MKYSLQIVQTGCIQEESFYVICYISQHSQNPDFVSMKFIIITHYYIVNKILISSKKLT